MRCRIAAALVGFLAATGQDARAAPPPAGDPYQRWVEEQLDLLARPVPLGAWRKGRPGEEVVLFRPGDAGVPLDRPWCARSETSLQLPDGAKATRYAFFHPPDPPAGLALPADGEVAGLVDRACTLGLVWTERREADAQRAGRVAAALRAALDRRFGKGQANAKLHFFNSASWSETGRWQSGGATMASAAERRHRGSWVLVFGFLPVSGLSLDGPGSDEREAVEQGKEPGLADVRPLVDQAGIPGAPRDALLAAASGGEDWRAGRVPGGAKLPGRKLVDGLAKWIGAAGKLEGRRRAAALLAADLVLEGCQYAYGVADPDEGSAARKALAALGAEFNDSPLGGVTSYTRSWLDAARKLDPDGPIGDRSFRLLMTKGFDTSGTCSSGSEQFREVIDEGERYLAGKHDPAAAAEVELMVADAYRDIVALAAGAAQDYVEGEASDYAAQAPDARRKAIQHYRKALAASPASAATRRAWGEAWRLAAGLPPAHLRFFCIYD